MRCVEYNTGERARPTRRCEKLGTSKDDYEDDDVHEAGSGQGCLKASPRRRAVGVYEHKTVTNRRGRLTFATPTSGPWTGVGGVDRGLTTGRAAHSPSLRYILAGGSRSSSVPPSTTRCGEYACGIGTGWATVVTSVRLFFARCVALGVGVDCIVGAGVIEGGAGRAGRAKA